jgi:hypothetical protein
MKSHCSLLLRILFSRRAPEPQARVGASCAGEIDTRMYPRTPSPAARLHAREKVIVNMPVLVPSLAR